MNRWAAGLAAGTLAGAGYWRHASPYSQACGPFPYRGGTSARTVALTFDDGPNEPFTSQVASVLEARGVRGTFFQVGRCVRRHPRTTRDLLAAGHVVGNHSHRHALTRGWRVEDVVGEVVEAEAAFVDEAGISPLLYRPPWLVRTRPVLEALRGRGLQVVSGEFCHAWEPVQPPAAWIARRALAKVRHGGIVIFHDGYDDRGGDRSSTVAAVEIVVDSLLDRGFSFVTVDQLLGVPAYRLPFSDGTRPRS